MTHDNPYTITHPATGDNATAETKQGADTAARWLRREAVEHGCSPRTRCTVVYEKTHT